MEIGVQVTLGRLARGCTYFVKSFLVLGSEIWNSDLKFLELQVSVVWNGLFCWRIDGCFKRLVKIFQLWEAVHIRVELIK